MMLFICPVKLGIFSWTFTGNNLCTQPLVATGGMTVLTLLSLQVQVSRGVLTPPLYSHILVFFYICNCPYELSSIQVVAQSFVSLVLLEQENELTSEQNKTILPH